MRDGQIISDEVKPAQDKKYSAAEKETSLNGILWYGISKTEIPTTENHSKLSPKAIFLLQKDFILTIKKVSLFGLFGLTI